MRFLRRSLTGLFFMALTVGLLVWAGWMVSDALEKRRAADHSTHPARERVFAVNVIEITPETLGPVLETFGEIRSRRSLELRARAGGTIVELAEGFVEGGKIGEGQLLLRTDPAEARSGLARAETDLLEAVAEERDALRSIALSREELISARAQADLRQNALARQQDLRSRGVGTEASVETAELAASVAGQALVASQQALARAEARVDLSATRLARQELAVRDSERALADTALYAAFSGTLGDVSVLRGGLVARNERLGVLTDPAQLEVAFRVSTSQYARLLDSDGNLIPAPVTVVLDVFGVGLQTEGVLSRESGSVADGMTGRLLFARINQPRGFRPGDFVTVRVQEPALHDVVRFPSMALNAAGEILVLDQEDRLQAVAVTLLRRQGDDVILRIDGFVGARVVAEQSPLLGAGIRVRPIVAESTPPAAPELLPLSDERRAALVAFVEASARMPAEAKARVLDQLSQEQVPARVVERIESRMGG